MTTTNPSVLRRIGSIFFLFITWPVRRWRVVAIILICLVVVYTVVDQMLLRQLAAQREQIRAAGGAVEFADLHLPKLKPEENAAIPYRHAAALLASIHASRNAEKAVERLNTVAPCTCGDDSGQEQAGAAFTEQDWKEIGEHVAASQAALEMVKEGCALKGCQFSNIESPEALVADPGAFLPDLTLVRSLARESATRAMWESHNGNVEGALQWVTLGLHLSNGLESEPFMIAGLVRVACAGHALNALQAVLCEHDAASAWLEQLARELTHVADRRLIAMTFQGERCYSAASYTNMSLHGGPGRPFMTLNQIKMNEFSGWIVDAALQNDIQQRNAAYKTIEVDAARMSRLYALAKLLAPALLRATDAFEYNIAQTNLAEIAVALKRYKKEAGSYPEELSLLVPKHIKELPLDTFSGIPYPYKQVGQGFKIYSVGRNQVDDGGVRKDRTHGDIVWCAKN
ncbi:MAG: hypothetical protein HZB26_20725 [Candidatus Hydrogenedentes bacterium]|nr:hypothetical protein [Candidatus Hydrogenedentota bacterium]